MTIISNPVQPAVCGQPISPSFGTQFAGAAQVANATISPPALMPLLEAMSRGITPRNALVTSVNGVSCGAQNPTAIGDLCSNGSGQQVNLGVAVAGVAGNPATNGANDQQQFVEGNGAQSNLVNGPTPTGIETLTSGPVSVNTLSGNVSLSGSFAG